MRLRATLALAPRAPLNPYALAARMKALVISLADIDGLSPEDRHQLLTVDPQSWSAGSIRLPQGEIAILLNHTHPETRKHATLMEELAHIHLDHTPSQLIFVNGMAVRSFKKTQETQAYWVGSAALVPSSVLQHAQLHDVPRAEVARGYKFSPALVSFRENVTGIRLGQ
jgi:hypothetical protein